METSQGKNRKGFQLPNLANRFIFTSTCVGKYALLMVIYTLNAMTWNLLNRLVFHNKHPGHHMKTYDQTHHMKTYATLFANQPCYPNAESLEKYIWSI